MTLIMKLTNILSGFEKEFWQNSEKNRGFLESLLTPNEKYNLILRFAVKKMVGAKKSYNQIAEELFISPQTISSIKKSLKANRYKSYRECSKTERKKKIYSSIGPPRKRRPAGRAVRTKYGTIYL